MKLLVVSHERSGTHLTLNSLYEDNCANVPTNDKLKINNFLSQYNDSRILKSHHPSEWFDDWVFDEYKIIYVTRNIFDTLTSMYFYCKRHTNIFGNFSNIEEFVWATPNMSNDDYSYSTPKTFIDRILNHRLSYNNKPVIEVEYETIVNNYNTFNQQMKSLKIPVRDLKPKMGQGQYVSPRKGIVGDYKNNMSSELIKDITNYIHKEYGYDTVK